MAMTRNNKMFLIFALCILVFVTYGNTLFNGFILDDGYLIVENPYIKSFKFFPNLFHGDLIDSTINLHSASSYYRPLSMFSFMVDYHIWHLNPLGFHLTNIIFHLLNTLLVFLIIFKISTNEWVSFLAAALFATHPIHVEAVTPIYDRMGLQVVFFMLSALWFFMNSENLNKKGYLLFSFLFFWAGLLSKEEAVVLPFIFLCYDYFYFVDFKWKNIRQGNRPVFYSICVLTCCAFLFLRHISLPRHPPFPFLSWTNTAYPALAGNYFLHVLTVIKILGDYIIKVLLPLKLSVIYWVEPVRSIFDLHVLRSLFILAIVCFYAVNMRKKSKHISFAIAVFFIGILPFSNIIPISESYVFHDRFLYFPSFGVCLILAQIILMIPGRFSLKANPKFTSLTIAFILVVLFSVTSAFLNYHWRSNLSLWKDMVKKIPWSQEAHQNLAQAYIELGRYDEAIEELEKGLAVPGLKAANHFYFTKLNLAKIYTETHRYEKAAQALKDAESIAGTARINPFETYNKFGILYSQLGKNNEAEENFKKALALNKNFVPAYYNLGVLYYENKRFDEAEPQLKEALLLDPDLAYAAYALGLNYLAQQRNNDAVGMFREALKINPQLSAAQQQLNIIEKRIDQ